MKLIIDAILQPHDTCDDAVMGRTKGWNLLESTIIFYYYILQSMFVGCFSMKPPLFASALKDLSNVFSA